MIGSRVTHSKYGDGIVKRMRHKGFELQVEFESGLTFWIRRDELNEPPITHQSTLVMGPPTTSTVSDERFKSRRMIEAFRLGIVPYDCVKEFTFGRDEEVKQINEWLDAPNESTMLIVGEYGTGKTHLLHYAIGHALQKGFAVAWVEMDPNESPFHKPKRVYSRLVSNFRYYSRQDGRLRGFHDFLKNVLAKDEFKDHLYFKCLREHYDDEEVWGWIEGREEKSIRPQRSDDCPYPLLPGLYYYSTAANIYCYLLSGLGWAAKEVLGLKGLLLVFDEAETVEMYYYSYQSEKSKNFLKSLIRTADGNRKLLRSPSRSGLEFCRKGMGQDTPFVYKIPSGLKLLFAFTSVNWNYDYYVGSSSVTRVSKIEEIDTVPRVNLESLTDSALKEVFEHICLLYDSAYDFLEDDLTIDEIFQRVTLESGRTRSFVKGAVEALDLARLNEE